MKVLKDIRQPITIANIPLTQFVIWFMIAVVTILLIVSYFNLVIFICGVSIIGGSFWGISRMAQLNLDFLTKFPHVIIMIWTRKKQ